MAVLNLGGFIKQCLREIHLVDGDKTVGREKSIE